MKVIFHNLYDNDLVVATAYLDFIPQKDEFLELEGKSYICLYVTHKLDVSLSERYNEA